MLIHFFIMEQQFHMAAFEIQYSASYNGVQIFTSENAYILHFHMIWQCSKTVFELLYKEVNMVNIINLLALD